MRSDSQPEQADRAREKALFILDRHIRAVGGEEVIRAVEYISISGSFEISGAPFIGSVTSIRAEPPRLMTRLEFGQMGTILQGYDGQIAWTLQPGSGPAILGGPERTSLIRSADVRGDLRYEQTYRIIEFLSDDVFEDEPVFAIRLVDHDGTETTEYYSKGTGLRVGLRGLRNTESGPIPYTRVLAAYAEYERLMVPTTTIERVGEQVITVTIEDVSFSKISPSRFAPPEPVRALLEAPGETPEPDGAP